MFLILLCYASNVVDLVINGGNDKSGGLGLRGVDQPEMALGGYESSRKAVPSLLLEANTVHWRAFAMASSAN